VPRRRKVTVWAIVDDVLVNETWHGRRLNYKIHADGRGYVRTEHVHVLYANVQRILVS
jgi:hypothetical protein